VIALVTVLHHRPRDSVTKATTPELRDALADRPDAPARISDLEPVFGDALADAIQLVFIGRRARKGAGRQTRPRGRFWLWCWTGAFVQIAGEERVR
jgi:hypothetical protein